MARLFPLSPRYRLDEGLPWLRGVDASRYYWIAVNSNAELLVAIPGLTVSSASELKLAIRTFRALQPGEQMAIFRLNDCCTIHCISENFYAIEAQVLDAPVWHLFDYETLDSLLMTSHPRWQSAFAAAEMERQSVPDAWQEAAA